MTSVAPAAGRLTYAEVEHELKTPLSTIRSVSEILLDCPELSLEERRRFVTVLLDENARLTGAVERLLGDPVLQQVLSEGARSPPARARRPGGRSRRAWRGWCGRRLQVDGAERRLAQGLGWSFWLHVGAPFWTEAAFSMPITLS